MLYQMTMLVRHCREGQSVFFTGCAGTGKSLLLKHILRALPKDSTFVTASTGLAASALGGITINAFAGFPLCPAHRPPSPQPPPSLLAPSPPSPPLLLLVA